MADEINDIGDEADETREAAAFLEEANREEDGEDEYMSDGETREEKEEEDTTKETPQIDSFSGLELEEVDMVEDEVAAEREDTGEVQKTAEEEEDMTGEIKQIADEGSTDDQNRELIFEDIDDDLEGASIPVPLVESAGVENEEKGEDGGEVHSPLGSPQHSSVEMPDLAVHDTVDAQPMESVDVDAREETQLQPPMHTVHQPVAAVKQEETDDPLDKATSSHASAASSMPVLQQMLDMSIVEPIPEAGEMRDETRPSSHSEKEEEEDDDIQVLKVVTPAVCLPLRISRPDAARGSMQDIQPSLSDRGQQRPPGGSEVMRPPQSMVQQPHPMTLHRGNFQQQTIPRTVMISHSPIVNSSGPSTSGGLNGPPSDTIFRTPYLPPPPSHLTHQMQQSMLLQMHMQRQSGQKCVQQPVHQSKQHMQPTELSVRQSLQQMMQSSRGRRRKRTAVTEREEIVEPQKEQEFCMGDHKALGRPIEYADDAPSCWVDGNGVKVIRMDKMEYPSEVPSRERIVCLDLCRYEGSEEWSDVRKTERILSWRADGLEYHLTAAATDLAAPPLPPATAVEAVRMKSPRPIQQTKQLKAVSAPMMRPKQGQGGSSGTTQVRLAPPPSQHRELDRDNHKAQVQQKIESARRHYAAAREASMLRMGPTYQIPQDDGTLKEFVLAHVPIEQARQPGFIQLMPGSVSVVSPPPPPPSSAVQNQRLRLGPSARSEAPASPPMDDLATRYAQYLAQLQKNGP